MVEGGVAGEQDPGGAEGEGVCECLEYGFVQSEEAAQERGRGGAGVMGGGGIEMTTMTYEDKQPRGMMAWHGWVSGSSRGFMRDLGMKGMAWLPPGM